MPFIHAFFFFSFFLKITRPITINAIGGDICSSYIRPVAQNLLVLLQAFIQPWPKPVVDNSVHALAGMADQAYGTLVLTLLEVAFLW